MTHRRKHTLWTLAGCFTLSLAAAANADTPQRTPTMTPNFGESAFGVMSHVGSADVRDALGLASSAVVSIDFAGADDASFDVISTSFASFPSQGADYFVMSTGSTSVAFNPNDSPSTSMILAGSNNSQGNDLTQLRLTLQQPTGATCLAFDFQFFSDEFPEFVGSQFNDAFIAEIDQGSPTPFQIVGNQIIAPDNFAFDAANNVVSINTTFGMTPEAAAGTTYDGASPTLTAVTPLEHANGQVTVTLSITDLGDSIYDSLAFVDNFRWFYGLNCTPGADADSDGDALLDDWETAGIDFDNDGTVDLDLPAFGADPQHKDVFIEIDYMTLSGSGGHTHKPKADALQIAIDAFANAPVSNPDGSTGIRAHIDAGSDTIMNPTTGALWGASTHSTVLTHQNNLGTTSGTGAYNWAAFDTIKGVGAGGAFDVARADVFHYCVFGHSLATSLTTTSGISRGITASDFLVTLGGWTSDVGSVNEQAGTLLHEFGHNLGLRHGGDDHANYEPNFLSVMNYSFQTRGLRVGSADGTFDYSRFLLPSLNEAALNETVGLSGVAEAASYGTRYYVGGATLIVNNLATIDWNNDGDATDNPVAIDVNKSSSLSTLLGQDDWDNIVFNGGSVGHLGEQIELPLETLSDDITEPEDGQLLTDFAVGVSGPAVVPLEACQEDVYEYAITNNGDNGDTYQLDAITSLGFGDLSVFPASLSLAPSETAVFYVDVSVPKAATVGSIDDVSVVVTSTSNALMLDSVETKTIVSVPTDADSDGFSTYCDACPASDTRSTIVIGTCNSGVSNRHFQEGCYLKDQVQSCAEGAGNHGAFVSCVAALTDNWAALGLIQARDRGRVVRCAAQSNIP